MVESAGKAIGLLKRDIGNVYAGIMLDHDLQESIITEADRNLSGKDVVDTIIQNIPNNVPILVHSANVTQGPAMVKRLEKLNYWVTRIPMSELRADSKITLHF